ncbi:hypothetical protein HK100_001608 [Physocladia obscura]|uniref:Uncharacterized protein n=1 Tax=Physocladia obscura TaxID=109957 RepID=A0AAD5T2K7_9FUNG|nr:hypothetical protein HK100_001608 [Physocladia obscura]
MFGNKADKRQANWERISAVAADKTARGSPSRSVAERNETIGTNPHRDANYARITTIADKKSLVGSSTHGVIFAEPVQIQPQNLQQNLQQNALLQPQHSRSQESPPAYSLIEENLIQSLDEPRSTSQKN